MHCGDAAPAFGGSIDHLFNALHPFGKLHFRTEGFEVGLDLGVLEIHFLARVVDEAFGEGAVEDEGAEHIPITEDLEDVGGLLVAVADGGDEFFGGGGIEWAPDIGAGLAHDGFAAEFVEVEDEFSLIDWQYLFWHERNLARSAGSVEDQKTCTFLPPRGCAAQERNVGANQGAEQSGSCFARDGNFMGDLWRRSETSL